jgi:pyridinium-3,5-bisthiocarboxylic acid mononucleotide nickel chelatase
MKIAYFDCFAGAGGDMILGALLDAGLEIDTLKTELAKLELTDYDIQVKKVTKRGIGGSQARVISYSPMEKDRDGHHIYKGDHHQRNFHDICNIIEKSKLSRKIKDKSINIFRRLAQAEAKVHRTSIEQIHFHEVGAVDAIIDVVGSVAGIEALGIEALYCSPLHVGSGTVVCFHGTLPVPAPATSELIREKPIYSTGVTGELLTPTGAAILTTLASRFGPMPEMVVEHIGYGSGEKDLSIPNLLRIFIGNTTDALSAYQSDSVGVVQTNIDDMNPQIYDYLIEKLFEKGILDIFLAPVHMKKNRPGTLVTVLCPPEMIGKVADLLMHETTSIGVRWHIDHRLKTQRRIEKVDTIYGIIRCKVAGTEDGKIMNVFPEYDDCKKAAFEKQVPIKDVMEKAITAASAINLKKI